MGFAFLPDSYLGFDVTIARRDGVPQSCGRKFGDVYQPFKYKTSNPYIDTFLSGTSIGTTQLTTPTNTFDGDDKVGWDRIVSITVNSTTYRVKKLIFCAQTLVGRAMRAFLVDLPDGRLGIIKDSWITTDRQTEANFLKGLDVPFCPQLINHCVLGNTGSF